MFTTEELEAIRQIILIPNGKRPDSKTLLSIVKKAKAELAKEEQAKD